MGETFRRVFLKPPDLSEEERARLAEGLAAAVDLQRQLATKSPHVLELTSGLQEDDRSFYVEHEPALAMPLGTFLDPAAPTADTEEVLLVAVALADALRVTHMSGRGRAAVHGGLSAGVLLRSSEEIVKIADFGIAPAVCAALGVDRYLNLAVGPEPQASARAETHLTGAWEVLSPDEYERDDRICGFIDPEKYGSGTLATFEPGSDIISAGFLLHLLAEHHHPYLDDPEEARMVELSEDMATRLYNGARRKDFRESVDPRIRCWCEVVARMLANIPKDRPSAAEIATAFSEVGVKPADAAAFIEGHLKALARLAQSGEWDELRSKAKAISGGEDVTPEAKVRADSFVCLADAHDLLEQALESIKSDDWPRAKEELGSLPDVAELPEDFADPVAASAREVRVVVERNFTACGELDEIERQIVRAMEQDLTAAKSSLGALVERLDKLPANDQLVAGLAARRERLAGQLRDKLESAEVILRAHAIAHEWLGKLQGARDQEQWDVVERFLGARPQIEHWPPSVLAEIDKVTQQLTDQAAGCEWVERLGLAVEDQDWDQADRVYKDKPTEIQWPPTLEAAAAALADRLLDAQTARKHLAELVQAVEAKNWNGANRIIQARPDLAHWPSRILEQEAPLRRRIAEKLKETADQHAAANDWAAKLEDACEKERWQEVEQSLTARPQIEHWPQDVLDRESAIKQRFADQAGARDHVDRLGSAVEAEEWKKAEEIRKEEPHLAYWPRSLRHEADGLVERLRDAAEAGKWITELSRAVDSKDWDAASQVLTARPGLTHFPKAVLAQEGRFRKAIEGHVTADREAQGLLRSAEEAAKREAFEQALKILDSIFARPDYFPSKRAREAQKQRKSYTANLEEKRRRQRADREQRVKALGAHYVRELISKSLAQYVHPDIVDTSVGGLKWASAAVEGKEHRKDDPSVADLFSTGRAVMTVAVRATSGRDQQTVSSSEFDFELSSQPPRVCDDRGAIQRELTADLKGFVQKVQKKQAAELTRPLREGMFPDAQIAVEFDKPVQRVGVAVYLLGAEVPEHRVDTELVWDNATLTWNFVDAFSFTRKVVEIVVGRAHELVGRKVLEGSDLLRKYGSVLTFGIAPPAVADDAGIPNVLAMEGWLAIRQNGNGDRRRLLTFPVVCPQVGTVQVDADLSPAETSLRSIVVSRQNSARATIEAELKTQIKAAHRLRTGATRGKAKLVALTKRIKSPIDHLQFEVKAGGERLPLTADWNIETFKFELPEDARTLVDEFLSPPPTPVLKRPPSTPDLRSPQAIEGPGSTGSQTSDASRRRRRAVTTAAVVLVIAVLAVGVPVIWPGLGTREGNENDNRISYQNENYNDAIDENENVQMVDGTNDNARVPGRENDNAAAVADQNENDNAAAPRLSTDQALVDVRNVMTDPQGSTYLADYAGDQEYTHSFIWEVEGEAEELPKIGYRVPGLEAPERPVNLQLTGDGYSVSPQDLQAIAHAVAELDPLLNNVAERVGDRVFADLDATFIDVTRLRSRQTAEWVLDADRKGWSASDAELIISVFTPADESVEEAAAENIPEIDLARYVTDLALSDGRMSPTEGELVDALEKAVLQGLQERQADSLQQGKDHLHDQTAYLEGVQVTQPERLEELRQTVNLSVKAPGLAERTFSLGWDPKRLVFDSETWQGTIDNIALAHGALTRINDEITETEDHWLHELSGDPRGDLIELRPPTKDEWLLGVTDPWAEPDSTAPRELPIHVTLDPDEPEEERLDDLELQRPAYWELITRYLQLEKDPYFLGQATSLATFVDGLRESQKLLQGDRAQRVGDLIAYLDEDPPPAYVIPHMELVGEPSFQWDVGGEGSEATAAQPNAVDLTLRPGFAPKPPDADDADAAGGPLAGVNIGYLDDAFEGKLLEVTQPQTLPNCTLSLTLDQSDGRGTQVLERWSDLAGAVDGLAHVVGEAEALNNLLVSRIVRAQVENELDARLGGLEHAELNPGEAYEFLKSIWQTKGSRVLEAKSLDAFSETRQNELKNRFKRKKRRVRPTIFIEYFSGPEWIHAVVWGARREDYSEEPVPEGPFLLRVCRTALLQQVPGTDAGGGIGGLLLDPVLDLLPEAVAAESGGPFSKQLGLAVALDVLMPGEKVLPTLEFAARTSFLEPADLQGGGDDDYLEWKSLKQLRDSPMACDFVLLPALSDSGPLRETASDEGDWAANALREAMREDETRGP